MLRFNAVGGAFRAKQLSARGCGNSARCSVELVAHSVNGAWLGVGRHRCIEIGKRGVRNFDVDFVMTI